MHNFLTEIGVGEEIFSSKPGRYLLGKECNCFADFLKRTKLTSFISAEPQPGQVVLTNKKDSKTVKLTLGWLDLRDTFYVELEHL
jgi:hypothetical protein